MNPHDYIISVNENGEPYLEHALFGKGGQKKDHKYYARAQDKGRWRYFYSPEEFRLWSSGGPKKKSTSEKMKSAFKQLKETGRKAVDTAADKLGVDERQALQNANRFNRARRQKAYDETPLGKAENAADRIAERVSSKVDELGNKLKTKSERMREELRKKTSQTAEDVQEKVKEKIREKAADIKETYENNKRQFDKAKEMEKAEAEAERQEKLANRPTAHEKSEVTGTAKDGAMKRRSMEKSTYGEYKDGDHDFDDANYKEENRVGDSGSGRSIDPHKVSPEFMLEVGYNSGLDVSALKVADARHAKAQRAYNKALSNPNTSSQEKDRLFRELTKAEKAYYDEADKIADELNQK